MQLFGFQLVIQHPKKTLAFYTKTLGMTLFDLTENDTQSIYIVGFHQEQTLQLVYDKTKKLPPYTLQPTDNYWKFSLFVDDIQAVYQRLTATNHSVGEPYQFGDIGYLAHTLDTENHQIEFIQKTFKDTPRPVALVKNPALGLLTLRTADSMKSIRLFEDVLAMKLHVRMHVERGGGFSLYFLGDNNLTPPSGDMDALENREWLYQQRHLFIELQHYWGSDHADDFSLNTADSPLQQLCFSGDLSALTERLTHHGIHFVRNTEQSLEQIRFETVDKHVIVVS